MKYCPAKSGRDLIVQVIVPSGDNVPNVEAIEDMETSKHFTCVSL